MTWPTQQPEPRTRSARTAMRSCPSRSRISCRGARVMAQQAAAGMANIAARLGGSGGRAAAFGPYSLADDRALGCPQGARKTKEHNAPRATRAQRRRD